MHVNLDFVSEADMVRKFRVALALQPVAVALFANSPFAEGRPSGYLSYRAHVWEDTDRQRCGFLPFVFEEDMGFERYTDYVLDVPMYFVFRNGRYIDASGSSFRDFMAGRLAVLPGERPTLADWASHLTCVFPLVRLKRHLEIRGADAGDPVARVPALAALWAGLLYDVDASDQAWERIRTWSRAERWALEHGVARDGLATPFRGGTVHDLALWMLHLAEQGLERRHNLNGQGTSEACYLEPLQAAARTGRTFAEELLRRFEDDWQGDFDVAMRAMCENTAS